MRRDPLYPAKPRRVLEVLPSGRDSTLDYAQGSDSRAAVAGDLRFLLERR